MATQHCYFADRYMQYMQYLVQGCEPSGVSKGMKNLMKKARAASKGVKKARAASKGDTVRLDFNHAGAKGAYMLVTNWKNAALNKAMDKLIEEADATRAMTLDQCYDAAMGMQKGKK